MVAGVVLSPSPVAAQEATPGFLDPAARVYTVAGGGAVLPRDGMPATEARLRIARVAAGPDGSIVFTEEAGTRAGWRIDMNGRLAALPALVIDGRRTRVCDVDFANDAALLGVTCVDGRVYRLAVGAAAWEPLPAQVAAPVTERPLEEIAALSDGGAIVASFDRISRLGPRGETVWSRSGPQDDIAQLSTDHLVGLPGDGAAAMGASGLAVFDGEGHQRRLRLASGAALTAHADGTLVVELGTGAVRMHRLDGHGRTLFGLTPRLGRGDGGPSRRALFEPGFEDGGLAVGLGGELLVADDVTLDASGALDMQAFRFGRGLVTDFDVPQRHGELLRVVGPAARPVVAIRPQTYRTITRGTVAVTSSFAGTARLRVLYRHRTVAEITAIVPPGDGMLALTRRLRPADYRLELSVADSVRRVTHRIGVSTRRRVDLRRARRTIARALDDYDYGDGGAYYELLARGCRRATAALIRCALWSRYTNFNDVDERCRGRIVVRQRPDGLRVVLRQRHVLCSGR